MQTTDWIQAGAAVASVFVALVIGVAAVLVARRSNGVSKDAVRVAEEAREISRDAVGQARRQTILASVPHLVAGRPSITAERIEINVMNGGPTVAYGILVSVAGATDRNLEAIDEDSRTHSGRQVSLVPGPRSLRLRMANTLSKSYPWLHVRLEYRSPLGARVSHDYLGPPAIADKRYRLHLVTIDPLDAGDAISFPIELGRFEPEEEPSRELRTLS